MRVALEYTRLCIIVEDVCCFQTHESGNLLMFYYSLDRHHDTPDACFSTEGLLCARYIDESYEPLIHSKDDIIYVRLQDVGKCF